ncbi:hypothetical protein [Rhodopseudomonas palustris]|uniref:hypothetical protein n=1 Tax=Rhodopseudomonas palustris TaxID=1076 RepID=UPI001304A3C0|nr:hypothetical protein [Rhodopseudomonas palustris]
MQTIASVLLRAAWRLEAATPVVIKSVCAEHTRLSPANRRLEGDAGTRTIILRLVIEQRRSAVSAPASLVSPDTERLGTVAGEVDDVSEIRV